MKFIESILLRNGVYHNLDLHQDRMNLVFKEYAPNLKPHLLSKILPALSIDGDYKVRLIYDMDTEDVEYNIEYSEYLPRKIKTLEVIPSDPFDYSFKYEDRAKINHLIQRSNADDIIITINKKITDGSYFNLAFWDGKEWLTPGTPLLKGVRRAQLLAEGKIKEAPISVAEIYAFEKVSLINAMMDLGELELPISAIDIPRTDD